MMKVMIVAMIMPIRGGIKNIGIVGKHFTILSEMLGTRITVNMNTANHVIMTAFFGMYDMLFYIPANLYTIYTMYEKTIETFWVHCTIFRDCISESLCLSDLMVTRTKQIELSVVILTIL
jgi:hypothetical protein